MPSPKSREVQRFLRVAKQRYDDALFLLGHRNRAAIYLAGYTVECALKSLVLSAVPVRKHAVVLASFRGNDAHSFESLKVRYIRAGGMSFPREIVKALSFVNSRTTALRYEPGEASPRDAELFLRYAEEIILWTNGRL